MEELRNLNDLDRGIHKQWIWGTKDNYEGAGEFTY